MASVKMFAVAGSAVLLSLTAAGAADLPLAPPPMPVVQDFSGWYLRGDIGFSNQKVKEIYNVLESAPGTSVTTPHASFDAAPFFGIGIGYQYNNWLRFDVTGEYRAGATFHGLQVVSFNGAVTGTDEYSATKSEWLAMANMYVDLGTWWCVTPFVGAGIGASYNRISNFVDVNTPNQGVAYAADTGKWNFAWALHAGLAYKVTPGFTVELAYRYLDLGDAVSGDLVTYTGVNALVNPEQFNNITSHDIKLGVRWMLNAPEPVYAPPLMRKG
ncbi:porin family protein [Rhodoplanes sp. TEM]|uniref:Porin family protein n=1 Tax=Rhodoplanes tepidamans TaxID=200616 RepID=A0ABT5JJI5_RHOTP|nr:MULTISPECIES: outer membrane protein [Rhodoplanes]MDC7789900.1 porin family protein [Rhodoplanes tepidamans]MDC7986652.1 porin family protein [Rhodoplanes sp. TEM]MDQ0354046.1 opacity protein-like surface antigen [Rhodoplanes tepidamans]